MKAIPVAALMPVLDRAGIALKEAVASRNGPVQDAHMLALAWSADADIWATDRDFAGTGTATWPAPNLIRGFAGHDAG